MYQCINVSILKEIAKYHKEWIKVAYKYLKNKEDAEDEVQNMYIKIHNKIIEEKINPLNIVYKNTINKHFIYKVIRNSCIDILRRKKPYFDIEHINLILHDEINEDEQAKGKIFIKIHDEIQTWTQTDKKIFELYLYTGLSMINISKIIGKSKSYVFNSIKESRKKIKIHYSEDMDDYFNNDFELI